MKEFVLHAQRIIWGEKNMSPESFEKALGSYVHKCYCKGCLFFIQLTFTEVYIAAIVAGSLVLSFVEQMRCRV